MITVTGIAAPHFYGRRALSSAVLTNHITLDLLSSSLSILSTPLPFLLSTLYPFYPFSILSSSCSPSVSSPLITITNRIQTFIPCLKPFPTHPCVLGDFSLSRQFASCAFHLSSSCYLFYFYPLLLISRSSKSLGSPCRSFNSTPDHRTHSLSWVHSLFSSHSLVDSRFILSSILDSFSHTLYIQLIATAIATIGT